MKRGWTKYETPDICKRLFTNKVLPSFAFTTVAILCGIDPSSVCIDFKGMLSCSCTKTSSVASTMLEVEIYTSLFAPNFLFYTIILLHFLDCTDHGRYLVILRCYSSQDWRFTPEYGSVWQQFAGHSEKFIVDDVKIPIQSHPAIDVSERTSLEPRYNGPYLGIIHIIWKELPYA